jgi:hypothetical protein
MSETNTPEQSDDHALPPEAEESSRLEALRARAGGMSAETAPVMAKFAEVNAACVCSGICPSCVGATAASIALPIVTKFTRKAPK